jgi:hypothetical protein
VYDARESAFLAKEPCSKINFPKLNFPTFSVGNCHRWRRAASTAALQSVKIPDGMADAHVQQIRELAEHAASKYFEKSPYDEDIVNGLLSNYAPVITVSIVRGVCLSN